MAATPAAAVVDLPAVERMVSEAEAECQAEDVDVLGDFEDDEDRPPRQGQTTVAAEAKASSSSGPVATLLLPEDNVQAHRFVAMAAGAIGVAVAEEEIAPRVFYPAAQKLIYRVGVFLLLERWQKGFE